MGLPLLCRVLQPHPTCPQDANGPPRELRPRLCHLRKGPQGYGFNLHSDKSRPGQYIRSVDIGSPAAHSGLRAQDRLIEVPTGRRDPLPMCPQVPGETLEPEPPAGDSSDEYLMSCWAGVLGAQGLSLGRADPHCPCR